MGQNEVMNLPLVNRDLYSLLNLTGGLYVGPVDGELIAGSMASAREHRLEHELLGRAELGRRYPQFHVPDDWVVGTWWRKR